MLANICEWKYLFLDSKLIEAIVFILGTYRKQTVFS